MTVLPILIAGGGIAGLASALGLSRAGRTTTVLEQALDFEEVGAGLQMSPNAVKALRWLGAWDAVAPSCVIPAELHVRDGRSGALLQRTRLGKSFEQRFGSPYRVCHRADLLAGLAQAARRCPNVLLRNSARVEFCSTAHDAVEVALSDGATERGEALIAADGIGSRLRPRIAGTFDPRFAGHVIYRALVPFDAVPTAIEADCVTLWLYPGGHAVHYAVSNWRSFNVVVAVDAEDGSAGWGQTVGGAVVRNRFPNAAHTLADLLQRPSAWLAWRGADLPRLPRWANDRTVLVGDAAHATLPYLAQGAAMAIEDACVLSQSLASLPSVPQAFKAFEAMRSPRTSRIQSESRKLASLFHARGLTAVARNAALQLMGPDAAMNRNRWIYEWSPDLT